ncbi:HNH endonuclease, partial [Leptospira sp. SA-E8]|uniref:HNH endonuclease n=2 Tax=Leptospira sp. SA-E8 TaxID=3422259 RepID=UPI003EBE409A
DKDPDIAAAIEVKRISIISGGYSTKDRKVPESLRAQVFKLSKNRCAICGKLGREVDHIKGSSNDIENLQLLCWD